ncbi:hypothetical protein ABFX02_05G007500 [Erythranthe guttata]
MGRTACCEKMGLKKGPWTPEEDEKLLAYIHEHGHGSWRALPSKAGLRRCGKSCRLRWANYLRPDIKRGKFSLQEEETIIQLHALLGNRWSAIATHLPKRTDNEIKNYWNTHLKKKLTKMGIDPITHKPKNLVAVDCGQSKEIANISHMAQWESARLEAEARLVLRGAPNPFHSDLSFVNKSAAAAPPLPPRPRPPCLDILKVWAWTNPDKDISTMILNGYSPSSWSIINQPTQNTPTSNFSENTVHIQDVGVGLFNGDSSINAIPNVKGIMGNSMELHYTTTTNMNPTSDDYTTSSYTNGDSFLGFPSFVEGFVDVPSSAVQNGYSDGNNNNNSNNVVVGGGWGVLDESNVNCWNNVLDFPTCSPPMGSSVLL